MPTFSQQIDYSLPNSDCLEISLFGPGIGECLVIHYGNGDWFVVDSCIDSETRNPVAIDYLTSIGVSLDQVKGILITHWHSDHTAGAAILIKNCHNANLYIPSALKSEQASKLLGLYQKNKFNSLDKPLREYSEIIDFLMQTGARQRLRVVGANYTFFDKKDLGVKLVALSPSPASVNQAIASLTHITPADKSDRLLLTLPIGPNLNAVALHLTFADFSALLGSDLECSNNPDVGWLAVLNNQIYSQLQLSRSDIFKVPHHGSETGHHDKIWSDLLNNLPISMATPFFRSHLPREQDIDRISSLSSVFALSKMKISQKAPKRDKIVESIVKSCVKSITPIDGAVGHIQLRASSIETTININQHPVLYGK